MWENIFPRKLKLTHTDAERGERHRRLFFIYTRKRLQQREAKEESSSLESKRKCWFWLPDDVFALWKPRSWWHRWSASSQSMIADSTKKRFSWKFWGEKSKIYERKIQQRVKFFLSLRARLSLWRGGKRVKDKIDTREQFFLSQPRNARWIESSHRLIELHDSLSEPEEGGNKEKLCECLQVSKRKEKFRQGEGIIQYSGGLDQVSISVSSSRFLLLWHGRVASIRKLN